MFGFLKSDPIKKLEKEYAQLQEQAMQAQRNGKIDKYAELSAQAQEVFQKIETLKSAQ